MLPSGKVVDKAPRRAGRNGTGTNTGTGTGTGEGWLRRLAAYCWRYPRNVVLALAGTLVVTAVAAIVPLIQRQIVDDLVGPGHPAVWPLAVLLLGAALTSFAKKCCNDQAAAQKLHGAAQTSFTKKCISDAAGS